MRAAGTALNPNNENLHLREMPANTLARGFDRRELEKDLTGRMSAVMPPVLILHHHHIQGHLDEDVDAGHEQLPTSFRNWLAFFALSAISSVLAPSSTV